MVLKGHMKSGEQVKIDDRELKKHFRVLADSTTTHTSDSLGSIEWSSYVNKPDERCPEQRARRLDRYGR